MLDMQFIFSTDNICCYTFTVFERDYKLMMMNISYYILVNYKNLIYISNIIETNRISYHGTIFC